MYVDPTAGSGTCPLVIPYPNPYVPPFPAPTITQPLAQLRQPYIVTLASNAKSSTTKKHSEDLVPIRLAVAFAPSRAAAKQSGNIFHRQNKAKMLESLFVMANHGVLLEYSCEALPDVNTKDNICESSPIKLQVIFRSARFYSWICSVHPAKFGVHTTPHSGAEFGVALHSAFH